ncbi:glycosyltransferase family 4 protein [Catalinimonas niigatensis]|uniref:glycosyltransferase family 4 protein n=1 Tax=Catalinimonas niigatensis TaxID=1397264 RepID=UPI002666B0E4|nr:glycosyltransferase family 4 protein [Catalinimonas niigatensis]WPP53318.1 glycosyltransferase family 4 protein [Catalinimonas niigatensis]
MKVVFISHDAGAYGAPRSLLDLIEGLKKLNVNCYVIIPHHGALVKELEKRNIPFKIIPYKIWVHKQRNSLRDKLIHAIKSFPKNRVRRAIVNVKAVFKIRIQLILWNADVVYTNSSVTPAGALAAISLGKPHIWHVREFQKLDQGLILDWGNGIMHYLMKKSSATIFVSQAVQDYYQIQLKIPNGRVIYNGVASMQDFDRIRAEKEAYSKPKDAPYTFCIVGRLTLQKGQTEAIKALAILSERGWNVKLIVAGSGDQERLKKLSYELRIEYAVDIIGRTDDPFAVYFQSDACLMCSIHEAFGRVTIEAMAATLAVIGKKNSYTGTEELIQHESTGLLYSGDEVVLADTMELLLQNPEWGVTLGRNAWQYAKDHFNRNIYVEKIYSVLKEVSTTS